MKPTELSIFLVPLILSVSLSLYAAGCPLLVGSIIVVVVASLFFRVLS